MEPPRSRTLPDLLDEMAARAPGHEFIVGSSGDERLSYGETRARVRQLAKGLLRLGVRRDDMVALLMDNRPEWLLIDFAAALLTIPRFGGQDYLAALGELGGPGGSRLPHLRRVVVHGDPHAALTAFDTLWDLGQDVPDAEIDAAQRAVSPEDVAYILYTSGTTSAPKGVQLCHGGLIEN